MSPTVSMMQLKHYAQLNKTGKFERFDHGNDNELHYGTLTPPEYNLSNIAVPTYLYHAEQDILVDKTGVDKLASLLPNVQNYKIIPDFNHLDVMLGKDSRELLYNEMLFYLNE